ncbi:MAG: glycoside hydrolase family 15 protein, partial [bacterium]|nr:glycoside hydrolase family 15 protein [bacterium]
MAQLDLGILGNGSFAALVDDKGRNVWCCLPRFDGDPIFSSLLAGKGEPEFGFFDVVLEGFTTSEQAYLRNSAILVTRLHDSNGGVVEITDFAPRYRERERMYRPLMLVRQIRRISGDPRIRIRLRATTDYGVHVENTTHGSNHIRYVLADSTIRLTTNASVNYVLEERPFVLDEGIDLVLGPDESL